MSTVHVERFNRDTRPTMGRVSIGEETIGFSLEDRHRDEKVAGDTCIPAGRYPLRWRTAGRWAQRYRARGFPGSLEIYGVPNFTAVLAHPGNTVRDTAGCLLVGRIADLDARTIGRSRAAIDRLYEIVHRTGGDWMIEYVDSGGGRVLIGGRQPGQGVAPR